MRVTSVKGRVTKGVGVLEYRNNGIVADHDSNISLFHCCDVSRSTGENMIKARTQFTQLIILLLLGVLATPAIGQQEPSAEELAKKTQNPVADLISVPLQNNWNFNAGFHHNKTIYILNVQP